MKKMIITDLDGTLFASNGRISFKNLEMLRKLKRSNIIIVIATGRNIYSANRVLGKDFPIDYLIFSSGAGIIDWSSKKIISSRSLTKNDIYLTIESFKNEYIDFMIHHAIPDNHIFAYHLTGKHNPDFLRRVELYRDFAYEYDTKKHELDEACQFVGIEPAQSGLSKIEVIKSKLDKLNIVRATSPLDHKSVWIEVFPRDVSKSIAGMKLASACGISENNIAVIGNDYNDADLLTWVDNSFVVSNAPPDLRQQHLVVSSNDSNGFSEAVGIFMGWNIK